MVSTEIHDKQNDFAFHIANISFRERYVARRTSYGVYISQLIRYPRATRNHSGLVENYNVSLRKLLQQGISELDDCGGLFDIIRKNCKQL